MAYSRDTEVELKGTFRRTSDDALTSPTDVTLEVLDPAGTLTTYTLAASQVTEESTGVFTRAEVLDQSGVWYYRYKGTGAVKVSDWKRIDVTDDPLD
jgi:hypothetical protein